MNLPTSRASEDATNHVVSKSSSGFNQILPFSSQYFVKRNRSVERPEGPAKIAPPVFALPKPIDEIDLHERCDDRLQLRFPDQRSRFSDLPTEPMRCLCERAWPSERLVKGDRVQRSASVCQSSVFLRQPCRRRQTLP